MSAGAKWVRAALQVDPFSDEGRNAPKNHFPDEDAYNAAVLEECEALGIALIGVCCTDR
ncbi:hypothetical protein ACPPVW_14095 [Leifsonia sp. McL0607]|uniref:hypothetical protein n=1 Tax=Leifsonia sp. McL0607 TaxID=3415672 RepID=UPI003CF01A46